MQKDKCSVEGCEREIVNRNPKLCLMHYKRWKKWGNPNITHTTNRKNVGQCRIKGCNRDSYCRELCMRHYQSWKRYGDAVHSDQYIENRRNNKKEPYIRKNGREIHKTIIENKIRRKLNKGEIVHHIDLDKRNNEESNLHLCKDRTTHNGCHHSLELAAAQLIKTKHIIFENGKYRINI